MQLIEFAKKYSFIFGITIMLFAVIGTFLEGGSLLQKIFFFITGSGLTFTACLNKQKMFITLQIIVVLSTIIAFFNLTNMFRYAILVGGAIISVSYLIKINYIKEDVWWPIGGLGLLVLAGGFATNAVAYPVLFNSLLGIAGILIAIYSAIGFFHLKIKVSLIFLILNVIFAIKPVITVFSRILA